MHKKFVFFGTPFVARDTLAALLSAGYTPSLVVTSPDAPRGRGMVLTPSETKVFAKENNLPVITPEKLPPDIVEEIQKAGAEYAVVVAYGKMLPESLIQAFPLGALNVHYSLLPKYRGASPVESALLNGETVTGVTVQQMVKEMDAGDILAMREVAVEREETTRELRPRLIQVGSELLIETLPTFENESIVPTPQDHTKASFAKKIQKSEGELDLSGDALLNWNKYRAFTESPGTYFYMGGKRVKIKTAKFENDTFTPLRVVPEGKPETDFSSIR